MADTITANRTAAGAVEASHRQRLYSSEGKISRVFGPVLLKFSRELTDAEVASFDGAGDVLEFGVLPANCYVVGARLKTPDMDAHATPTASVALKVGSTALHTKVTPAASGAVDQTVFGGLQYAGGEKLTLTIVDAPATAQTSYASAFEAEVLLFIGAPTLV